jgi:fibronectin type 3 domain-containing protein
MAPGLIYLQWVVPVADNGSPVTGYRVYRRTAGEQFSLLVTKGAASFSADDVQVTSGQTYVYAVTAVNAVGESSMSNEVAITAI